MKKTDLYFYPAVFTYEKGQEIAAAFPDLDAATSGEIEEDALLSARELLRCVLVGMEADEIAIPEPSELRDIVLKGNERAVLVDVDLPTVCRVQEN